MSLLEKAEHAFVGTVFTATRDMKYTNRNPYFVGKGAHFSVTGVEWRGIYAHTGNVKVDEFWTWPRLAGILVPSRGIGGWEIQFPERTRKERRPFLERIRVRAPAESR